MSPPSRATLVAIAATAAAYTAVWALAHAFMGWPLW